MIFGLFKKRTPPPAMMLMGLFKATIDRFLVSKGADPSKLRLENKIVAYALTTTRSLYAVVSDSPSKEGISLPPSASIYQKAVILLIGMECIQMLYGMAHPPELGSHNQEDLVPRHRGFDGLISSHSRIGRFCGATRSSMLLGTPGWRRIRPLRSSVTII